MAEAVQRAHREGFTSLGVEVIGGTPAVRFYEDAGFDCAYTETRSVLELANVDWLRLGEMAAGIGAGYRVEYHPGGPPEELYESYAAAKYVTRGQGDPADALRPSSLNAERLRASLETLHMRGLKPYVVLGVHEATGEVAGLTEVVVAAQHPGSRRSVRHDRGAGAPWLRSEPGASRRGCCSSCGPPSRA